MNADFFLSFLYAVPFLMLKHYTEAIIDILHTERFKWQETNEQIVKYIQYK